MDNWFIIIAVAVVVIAAFIMFDRQRRSTRDAAQRQSGASRTGDYLADRESTRLDRMSAEDREWEQASLRKSQGQPGQAAPPSAPTPPPSAPTNPDTRDGNPAP